MFDLTGKVAVVTGGNGGIGLGMARGLAKAGATIAIWARDAEKSASAQQELASLGADVLVTRCDVADPADIQRALEETVERFRRVDIGIANAGYGAPGDPMELTLEAWREVLSVNLDGAFLTLQALARHMVERGGGGKLLATTSISEIHGSPMQAHYASSKGALGALVRSLAVRLARYDIQVNAVQPGWIETAATAPALQYAKLHDTIVKRTPARRWGTPEDLEGITVYLASDASRFHTGDSIRIDGGYAIF